MLEGRWRLLEVIGRGGHATVWRGEHTRLGRVAAIKTLAPDLAAIDFDGARRRLLAEATLGATVEHPRVARVLDVCVDDAAVPFLATEFVDGESLRAHLDRVGRLDVAQSVDVARAVLAGLAALGDQRIVHRDVKPSNVMLPRRGLGASAVLIDLGIARRIEGSDGVATSEGLVVGTPSYMAPEQLRAGPVDGRADVYALGVVLFECLTGIAPRAPVFVERFLVDPTLEVDPLPSIRARVPSCPVWLDGIVRRATDPVPTARFSGARDMSEALEVLARDLGLSRGPRAWSGPEALGPAATSRDTAATRRLAQASEAPTRRASAVTAWATSTIAADFAR